MHSNEEETKKKVEWSSFLDVSNEIPHPHRLSPPPPPYSPPSRWRRSVRRDLDKHILFFTELAIIVLRVLF